MAIAKPEEGRSSRLAPIKSGPWGALNSTEVSTSDEPQPQILLSPGRLPQNLILMGTPHLHITTAFTHWVLLPHSYHLAYLHSHYRNSSASTTTSQHYHATIMHFAGLVTALLAGAAAVASTALPADASAHHLEARANGATCGTVSYSASAITAASDRACKYYKDKTPANDYPHTFNNREGFVFATSGPYIEFPIMKTGVLYSGGAYCVNIAASLSLSSVSLRPLY